MSKTDKIDYETAKFIFDAIQDSLGSYGLEWSRIGRYQELCKSKLEKRDSPTNGDGGK